MPVKIFLYIIMPGKSRVRGYCHRGNIFLVSAKDRSPMLHGQHHRTFGYYRISLRTLPENPSLSALGMNGCLERSKDLAAHGRLRASVGMNESIRTQYRVLHVCCSLQL